MKRSTRALLSAAVGLSVLAAQAAAQDDGEGNDPKNHTCDKAAKTLAKGHPAKKELWALGVIATCADGASALANNWSPLPTDSTELFFLAAASRDVNDARVLNAALAVVQNPSVPRSARHIAINVVLAQYAPNISVSSQPDWTDYTTLGISQDFSQHAGEQPVSATDRQRIISAFRVLSTTDPDLQVRKISAQIAGALSAVCDGKPCLPPPAD